MYLECTLTSSIYVPCGVGNQQIQVAYMYLDKMRPKGQNALNLKRKMIQVAKFLIFAFKVHNNNSFYRILPGRRSLRGRKYEGGRGRKFRAAWI